MNKNVTTYKTISEYLFEEIEKYKEVFNSCNTYEKIHFKTYLKKYEWQFENKKDFIKWYVQIVN